MLPNEGPTEGNPQQPPTENIGETGEIIAEEKPSKKKILFLLVSILTVGIAVYFLFFQTPVTPTTSSITTTTITSQLSYISSCSNISVSGIYYLKNDIEFNKATPCITVKANNVKIFGNGHVIRGNGPYLNISPFSYGIIVNSSNNVVISNLTIKNCSYGIFIANSSNVKIDSNLDHNVLSSLVLQNSKSIKFNGNISSSTIFGVELKNSSNISINGNILRSGIYDLKCDYISGVLLSSSSFIGGCFNNSGCEFANCRRNYPINLESLSQKIEGCGIIDKPGKYFVSKDIYLSNISRFGINCLEIKVGNVSIDLNNKKIVGNGATTAIKIFNVNKVDIKNGALQTNSIAVSIFGSSNINLENVEIKGNDKGVLLNNSNANNFKNLKVLNNRIGIEIQNSLQNVFHNVSSYNNTFGFQLEKNSIGNFFEQGNSKNIKIDFSCDNSSGGIYLNTFSSSSCLVGNCLWANCTKILTPSLSSTKVKSCSVISSSGNYTLSNNLVSSSSCIQILASNVNLSCSGFSIQGNGIGNGILVKGDNVTLINCKISNFENSIYAKNSKYLRIIDTVNVGKIVLENVGYSSFINVTTTDFIVNKLYGSLIHNTSISNSFILNNSNSNKIIFTNIKKILFLNQSQNNSIATSKLQNVICDPSTNSINKNNGIATCASKNCVWFVCTSPLSSPCQPLRGYLSLFSDYVISAPVCFTVYSNDSTLDCNGHTLLGNSQNTLVFVNASRFTMKNCNVKNFSTVAKIYGAKFNFQNINISSSLYSIIGTASNSLFGNITIFSSPNITITGSNNIFKNILMK
jgi:parallel beta-helix repeat protein